MAPIHQLDSVLCNIKECESFRLLCGAAERFATRPRNARRADSSLITSCAVIGGAHAAAPLRVCATRSFKESRMGGLGSDSSVSRKTWDDPVGGSEAAVPFSTWYRSTQRLCELRRLCLRGPNRLATRQGPATGMPYVRGGGVSDETSGAAARQKSAISDNGTYLKQGQHRASMLLGIRPPVTLKTLECRSILS
jgi:hypothetical protein